LIMNPETGVVKQRASANRNGSSVTNYDENGLETVGGTSHSNSGALGSRDNTTEALDVDPETGVVRSRTTETRNGGSTVLYDPDGLETKGGSSWSRFGPGGARKSRTKEVDVDRETGIVRSRLTENENGSSLTFYDADGLETLYGVSTLNYGPLGARESKTVDVDMDRTTGIPRSRKTENRNGWSLTQYDADGLETAGTSHTNFGALGTRDSSTEAIAVDRETGVVRSRTSRNRNGWSLTKYDENGLETAGGTAHTNLGVPGNQDTETKEVRVDDRTGVVIYRRTENSLHSGRWSETTYDQNGFETGGQSLVNYGALGSRLTATQSVQVDEETGLVRFRWTATQNGWSKTAFDANGLETAQDPQTGRQSVSHSNFGVKGTQDTTTASVTVNQDTGVVTSRRTFTAISWSETHYDAETGLETAGGTSHTEAGAPGNQDTFTEAVTPDNDTGLVNYRRTRNDKYRARWSEVYYDRDGMEATTGPGGIAGSSTVDYGALGSRVTLTVAAQCNLNTGLVSFRRTATQNGWSETLYDANGLETAGGVSHSDFGAPANRDTATVAVEVNDWTGVVSFRRTRNVNYHDRWNEVEYDERGLEKGGRAHVDYGALGSRDTVTDSVRVDEETGLVSFRRTHTENGWSETYFDRDGFEVPGEGNQRSVSFNLHAAKNSQYTYTTAVEVEAQTGLVRFRRTENAAGWSETRYNEVGLEMMGGISHSNFGATGARDSRTLALEFHPETGVVTLRTTENANGRSTTVFDRDGLETAGGTSESKYGLLGDRVSRTKAVGVDRRTGVMRWRRTETANGWSLSKFDEHGLPAAGGDNTSYHGLGGGRYTVTTEIENDPQTGLTRYNKTVNDLGWTKMWYDANGLAERSQHWPLHPTPKHKGRKVTWEQKMTFERYLNDPVTGMKIRSYDESDKKKTSYTDYHPVLGLPVYSKESSNSPGRGSGSQTWTYANPATGVTYATFSKGHEGRKRYESITEYDPEYGNPVRTTSWDKTPGPKDPESRGGQVTKLNTSKYTGQETMGGRFGPGTTLEVITTAEGTWTSYYNAKNGHLLKKEARLNSGPLLIRNTKTTYDYDSQGGLTGSTAVSEYQPGGFVTRVVNTYDPDLDLPAWAQEPLTSTRYALYELKATQVTTTEFSYDPQSGGKLTSEETNALGRTVTRFDPVTNVAVESETWANFGPEGGRRTLTRFVVDMETGKTLETEAVNALGRTVVKFDPATGDLLSRETWKTYGDPAARHTVTRVTKTSDLTGKPEITRSVNDLGLTVTHHDPVKGTPLYTETWPGGAYRRTNLTVDENSGQIVAAVWSEGTPPQEVQHRTVYDPIYGNPVKTVTSGYGYEPPVEETIVSSTFTGDIGEVDGQVLAAGGRTRDMGVSLGVPPPAGTAAAGGKLHGAASAAGGAPGAAPAIGGVQAAAVGSAPEAELSLSSLLQTLPGWGIGGRVLHAALLVTAGQAVHGETLGERILRALVVAYRAVFGDLYRVSLIGQATERLARLVRLDPVKLSLGAGGVWSPGTEQAAAQEQARRAEGGVVRDEQGNVIELLDEKGAKHTFTYDESGCTETTIAAAGTVTVRHLDPAGRLLAESVPGISRTYSYEIGPQNQVVKTLVQERSEHGLTLLTYDPQGRLTAWEGNGVRKSFEYGTAGRDATLKITMQDTDGREIEQQTFRAGRLELLTRSDGSSSRYAYETDGSGGVLAMTVDLTNTVGGRTQLRYDGSGRLISALGDDANRFQQLDQEGNLAGQLFTFELERTLAGDPKLVGSRMEEVMQLPQGQIPQ
jgi:YD repeat-containing protein